MTLPRIQSLVRQRRVQALAIAMLVPFLAIAPFHLFMPAPVKAHGVAPPVQVGISDETDAELLQSPLAEGDPVVIGIHATNDGVPQTSLPGFGMRWRR